MLSKFQTGLIALLFSWSAHTLAGTSPCTEIIIPAIINQPGIYCFLNDHVISNISPAITIRSSNVVLDLNGHRLGSGRGSYVPGSPSLIGIDATDVKNVTIRNGTIRGFAIGISLRGEPSQGHLVENMLIEGVAGFGIFSMSDNSIFRLNRIYGVNPQPDGGMVFGTGGIYTAGDGISIQSNIVQNFTGDKNIYGIYASGTGIIAEGNFVSGILAQPSFYAYGIDVNGQSVVIDNKVFDIDSKWEQGAIGIQASENANLINNIVLGVIGRSYIWDGIFYGRNY